MGIMVGLPSPSGSEKDLQLNFGKNMTVQVEMRAPHLPAEWHHAERYTVNMATCRYRLGLHAGGSARVFYQYCQRNSEA